MGGAGIDQKDFLLNASVAEVEQEVAEVLELMKPAGGYIMSTVDYLSEDTPIENVQAFADAGMKYGRYREKRHSGMSRPVGSCTRRPSISKSSRGQSVIASR